MTIAALLNADPRPRNSGSRIRDGVFVDQLRQLGDVEVFAFDAAAGHDDPPGSDHHLRPHRPFPAAAARAAFHRRMVMQERYDFSLHGPAMIERLRRSTLTHAAELYAASWVTRSGIQTPLIWSTHDQDRAVWQQRAAAGPRWARPPYLREARLAERAVRSVLDRAELVVPPTDADAEVLASLGAKGRVEVIANGAWFDAWDECARRGPEREEIVIFGSMAQKVTAAGMAWFLDEVLPTLHRRRRPVHLRIVGREGHHRLEERLRAIPHTTRLADVESVPDAVAGASVIAVPQVRGTGSKLKLFETMAAGLPAVCTPEAAVGVDWLPEHLVVEDTASAFASALLERLDDPHGQVIARDEARRRFDWNVLGEQYRTAVVETIGAPLRAAS